MDLEIQTRQIELDPAWRDLIERLANGLSARYPELLRLHVTLTHLPHHRRGLEEVALLANTNRAALRTDKRAEHVRTAIHSAFRALSVELQRHHRERREVKGAPTVRGNPAGERTRG
jgi:ribosome-associated translation inhibitor RaiA